MKKIILLASVCFFVFSGISSATLWNSGNGLIYDDVLDITWLQDVNYAVTSGYDSDGLLNWAQTNAFIDYLNSSNYLGYSGWRLPKSIPVTGTSFNDTFSYDGSTDFGYNITSVNNELAYMYYVNLGNLGSYDTDGNERDPSVVGFVNTGPFVNFLRQEF